MKNSTSGLAMNFEKDANISAAVAMSAAAKLVAGFLGGKLTLCVLYEFQKMGSYMAVKVVHDTHTQTRSS